MTNVSPQAASDVVYDDSAIEFVARHDVLDTEDFQFEIDEYRWAGGEQFLLAHIRVKRWSKSVCKRIRDQWRVFRQCVTLPIYALPKDNDARWAKFVGMLGFEPFIPEILCNNGAQRPLFIHVIKDANVVRNRQEHPDVVPDDPLGPAGRRAH